MEPQARAMSVPVEVLAGLQGRRFALVGFESPEQEDLASVLGDAQVLSRASTPREATRAADALVGRRLTTETIETAAEVAAGPAKPLDNTDLTHPYRKKVTRVYVARALARIAGLDHGPATEAIA